MGSYTPPEDLKARFQGAGWGYPHFMRFPFPFLATPYEELNPSSRITEDTAVFRKAVRELGSHTAAGGILPVWSNL